MLFMAYTPQLAVSVETSYWSGNARFNEEKGRRALRRRPCPATAGSRGPVPLLFTLAFTDSTEHLVGAIARGYDVILLRYNRAGDLV